MTRKLFPDEGSRLVYAVASTSGRQLKSQTGRTCYVYSDAAGTIPADITDTAGSGLTALVTNEQSLLPIFYGPADGTDTLYVLPEGGSLQRVFARADERLDALEANSTAWVLAVGTEANTRSVADAAETAARIAADATKLSITDASATYVKGEIVDSAGATVANKKVRVILDAFGDIDDLVMEDA